MPHLFQRLLLLTLPVSDPWHRREGCVSATLFGSGCSRDLGWYLQGRSIVQAGSLPGIQAWLSDCDYVTDPELFHERDHWQHPAEFERLRRGDCEDFALWAWRKLVELGYDAELVAGHYSGAGAACGHAWVLYHCSGGTFLFDPVVRDPAGMVRPLDQVRHFYVPEFSADARLHCYVYDGYLIGLRQAYRRRMPFLKAFHAPRIRVGLSLLRAASHLMHRAGAVRQASASAHPIS